MTSTIEQGSDAWLQLRLGKVTASKMDSIMAKGKSGAPSATRGNYLAQLLCERLTGSPTESFVSAAMKNGTEMEPKARAYYAFMNNVDPQLVAFVDHPTIPMSGASPDSLIGDDGLLEIKCPEPKRHIETLLGAPIDTGYILQIQWQLACTGRAWCDFVSFSSLMPTHMQLVCKRIHRDGAKIVEMQKEVVQFLSELDARLAELKAKYPFPMVEAAE